MKKGKEELRRILKSMRNEFSKTKLQEKSIQIENKLENFEKFLLSKNILFYFPINNEVNTLNLIKKYIGIKNIYLPKTNKDQLSFHKINNIEELKKGNYSIYEPPEINDTADLKCIDLIIVPLLAVDKNGNRLGYGKGYYDKFLKECSGYKVGLAYDFQIIENVPGESHDQRLDLIISEKQIINTNKQ